jgi:glycerol-1-phosphate dehydrogenase [NAD(P)+]
VIHFAGLRKATIEEPSVKNRLPVYIGPDAVGHLVQYCRDHDLSHFAMIVDANTYRALGQEAEAALKGQGWDVLTVLLKGDDIIADAHYVFQAMLALDHTPRTFIAVGSGTITDITRFISHRSGREFISLPTAPSVDGFTSIGAPLVIEMVKTTVNCHGPRAVFADLPVLCTAPRKMIAAGFGDMLAKFTASADWELGSMFGEDAFVEPIAARMRSATWDCGHRADAIAAGSPEGVQTLMEGLIESGFCLLEYGSTLPASGWEHHISHTLEMKLLREGRHSILHGAKVGIGVLASARRYGIVQQMSRDEAAARLQARPLPDIDEEIRGIRATYGPIADGVIAIQQPWFAMTAVEFEALKARVVEVWDDIRRVAAVVPPAELMQGWISAAGGPGRGPEAGLSEEEVTLATTWGRCLKHRMTIGRLSWMLGIE